MKASRPLRVIGSGPDTFDVSIVLNLHNEARYLRRTLLSLEEAVRYAHQFDISFELVVVLDNADAATTKLAENYDYSVFDGFQIIRVSNGSLGLSRNSGIDKARGEYITTADGDDLIAFDFLQKTYMTCISCSGKSIVFPEYIFGFGSNCYVWKFYDSEYIGNISLYEYHPYISRVTFKRDLYNKVRYIDASHRSGYAYEDWHFNCQCLAFGYTIEIAKGAVLFYRQRPGSLLRRSDAETSRMIPACRYFEPVTYLKLGWAEMNGDRSLRKAAKPFSRQEFMETPGIAEIVAAANRIDPAITLGILNYSDAGSNLLPSRRLSEAYFHLCNAIANTQFTDVVLLPFLVKGGAEKYILSVLDALTRLQPNSRVLFLSGQPSSRHEWLDRLPEGSVFIDFPLFGFKPSS